MLTDKSEKRDGRGGPRKGAGRPKGSGKKVKICVSVDRQNWQVALRSWTGKASHLVERLILAHIKQGKSSQNLEAAT
jgi:hypothetical protein